MVRALVITHGGIGKELVRVAELILGPQEGLEAATNEGRSAADLVQLVKDWLDADPGTPAMVMIDDYGGSCANAAQLACRERGDTVVLGGVNLAMVLGFLTWRESDEPAALAQRIIDKGRDAIMKLGGAG